MTDHFDLVKSIQFARPVAEGDRKRPGPADDFWYKPSDFVGSSAGQRVSPDTAQRNATVFACVRILRESISSLPLDMYRRLPSGGQERFTAHPLHDVLKYQPNSFQSGVQFWDWMIMCCALRGGAYAEILSGPRGAVDQLIPLHPDYMQTEKMPGGRLRYQYQDPETKTRRTILQEDMFYIPMFSLNGVTPASPITLHRETIGLSMAATEHGARFFENNATPGGVIERQSEFKDDEAKRKFADDFQKAFTGGNKYKTAVLPVGAKYTPLSISSKDAQYLETRNFQRTEICGIYGVPPHMVGELSKATFSNIEHQGIEFVTYTLRPWLVRIEQAIRQSLIIAPNQFYAEFNADALLRGDTVARSNSYAQALGSGGHPPWLTVNEIRAMENRNPVEGGDQLANPVNMQTGGNPANQTGQAA